MTSTTLFSSVKQGLSQARTTFGIVTAHGAQAFSTGVQTLEAAKSVVVGAGSDTVAVLARARADLKQTFADGAAQLGEQLVRIAMPTRKEQAELRKAEVRRKKKAKQAEAGTFRPSEESLAPAAEPAS